jgi:hypothetical protein
VNVLVFLSKNYKEINMPCNNISQIDLFNSIVSHLHKKEGIKYALPREINKIIECCNAIVDEFKKPEIKAYKEMGLDAWLSCDDVGESSKFIVSILHGGKYRDYAYPLDSSDFGRCHGLLEAVPKFRQQLNKMAACGNEWKYIVEEWDLLESLYIEKKYKKLDSKIKELINLSR